jgi:diketogulonate reductase-like aldo/keto reductase
MSHTTITIPATGAQLPVIGVGTFGSDHVSAVEMAQAVKLALKIGYRNIDCASVYANEKEIGEVLHTSTIPRKELWITSKVWNDMHGKKNVIASAKQSLKDLRLDYSTCTWSTGVSQLPSTQVRCLQPQSGRPALHS